MCSTHMYPVKTRQFLWFSLVVPLVFASSSFGFRWPFWEALILKGWRGVQNPYRTF